MLSKHSMAVLTVSSLEETLRAKHNIKGLVPIYVAQLVRSQQRKLCFIKAY